MAVPLLFKPVWAAGRPMLDGAVGDVAGVDGLERSERVLYHHVSCRVVTPIAQARQVELLVGTTSIHQLLVSKT